MTRLHTIPLDDEQFHIVSDDEIESLQASFPDLDVRSEITKLEAWLSLNVKRRRMTPDMGEFVRNWLTYASKAVNPSAQKGESNA